MKARVAKRETENHLELCLQMYVDQVTLELDKQLCLKCDICSLVCPREAVRIIPGEEDLDITIDPRLCVLCEICSHFCPVAAISLSYNHRPKTMFADQQGLAPFLPKINIDTGKCPLPCPINPESDWRWCRRELKLVPNTETDCPKHCQVCIETCQRQAIIWDQEGESVVPQPEFCLRCTQCLQSCEYDAIEVNPQFLGRLLIDDSKCPLDCNKCINLCPTKAIVREGERVFLRFEDCAYCGVCLNICDQDAITLIREEVVAEPGEYSQAWEQAVAKLIKN
ncbi:MAG: 4Fe-4S binding protein [Deltaproteobacteria bacterium]|nr:4Fe-4S binding protein [Deltaproteobacteria bacterium]